MQSTSWRPFLAKCDCLVGHSEGILKATESEVRIVLTLQHFDHVVHDRSLIVACGHKDEAVADGFSVQLLRLQQGCNRLVQGGLGSHLRRILGLQAQALC